MESGDSITRCCRRSQPPPYCPEWRQEQEPQPHYPRKERRLSVCSKYCLEYLCIPPVLLLLHLQAGNPATNNQNYGSDAPAAVELRPPSLHRKIQVGPLDGAGSAVVPPPRDKLPLVGTMVHTPTRWTRCWSTTPPWQSKAWWLPSFGTNGKLVFANLVLVVYNYF